MMSAILSLIEMADTNSEKKNTVNGNSGHSSTTLENRAKLYPMAADKRSPKTLTLLSPRYSVDVPVNFNLFFILVYTWYYK